MSLTKLVVTPNDATLTLHFGLKDIVDRRSLEKALRAFVRTIHTGIFILVPVPQVLDAVTGVALEQTSSNKVTLVLSESTFSTRNGPIENYAVYVEAVQFSIGKQKFVPVPKTNVVIYSIIIFID